MNPIEIVTLVIALAALIIAVTALVRIIRRAR